MPFCRVFCPACAAYYIIYSTCAYTCLQKAQNKRIMKSPQRAAARVLARPRQPPRSHAYILTTCSVLHEQKKKKMCLARVRGRQSQCARTRARAEDSPSLCRERNEKNDASQLVRGPFLLIGSVADGRAGGGWRGGEAERREALVNTHRNAPCAEFICDCMHKLLLAKHACGGARCCLPTQINYTYISWAPCATS